MLPCLFVNTFALLAVIASVIPYPAIVVGVPANELNIPSNASVIPKPAIVVGLLVILDHAGVPAFAIQS